MPKPEKNWLRRKRKPKQFCHDCGTSRWAGKRKIASLFEKYYSEPDKWAFPKPDILIYLKVSFPKMLRGIKERAQWDLTRKVELQESEGYWKRLWELHEEWVAGNPLGLNIVILDMDKFALSGYKARKQALETAYQELVTQSGGLLK